MLDERYNVQCIFNIHTNHSMFNSYSIDVSAGDLETKNLALVRHFVNKWTSCGCSGWSSQLT